jgi:hypothetical protein
VKQTAVILLWTGINFDNPKDDCIIIYRLNTWLKAIGRIDIEVVSKENIKGLK